MTPKVGVRGALIDAGDRLLMMREVAEGRWSLPGGFAEPMDTPSEAVVREETGGSNTPQRAMPTLWTSHDVTPVVGAGHGCVLSAIAGAWGSTASATALPYRP